MLLVSRISFNSKTNQKPTINNQNYSAKFNSQSMKDPVNFGTSLIKVVRTIEDQEKLISEFIGEPVSHAQGWLFISNNTYTFAELEKLYHRALGKKQYIEQKLGHYNQKNQVGECVARAYDYSLKAGEDCPMWYEEAKTKTHFTVSALPVGESDCVNSYRFSDKMIKVLRKEIKKGNNIVNYNGQKYTIGESFNCSSWAEPEFMGFVIGLAK